MSGNMDIYESLRRPPAWALRPIDAGNLKGKTDINPQWRIQALTEEFGPEGIGWKYVVTEKNVYPGADGEVICTVDILLQYIIPEVGEWSDPVPGFGGNKMIQATSKGLKSNDECWKMAKTDAISDAAKQIGVGADIYADMWDGSKYRDIQEKTPAGTQKKQNQKPEVTLAGGPATPEETEKIKQIACTKYANGEPVFTNNEVSDFKKMREIKTAKEVIDLMENEKNTRLKADFNLTNTFKDDDVPF